VADFRRDEYRDVAKVGNMEIEHLQNRRQLISLSLMKIAKKQPSDSFPDS